MRLITLADTAWSPRRVLGRADGALLEGAIFAAGCIARQRISALLLDFEAEHDTDHVIAIFRENGCLGRRRQIELQRMPLARTHPSHAARTGTDLFQYLLQPSTGAHLAAIFRFRLT